ncbi:MAG: hypothetical protein DMF63_14030 [Acidobacteria bacterium]|nr:MAG: hypothetical protein DMF63_14030 [Acidobacteriota bacterium]
MIRLTAAVLVTIVALCALVSAQDKAPKAVEKLPVSYGLVVDNSGSFRMLLDRVITVAADVVDENGADDETFLVTFVDTPKIALRQEFTYRKSELHDAAQNMFIEGGQTAILDAVKSAADYLSENARRDDGRLRALVLITDGEDRGSVSKIDDVLKLLKEQNIRVFVIAMTDTKVFTKIIDRLAKDTGGSVVVSKVRADLPAAVKLVTAQMRTR